MDRFLVMETMYKLEVCFVINYEHCVLIEDKSLVVWR